MTDKVMDSGTWFFKHDIGAWCKTRAGYRELGLVPDIDIEINEYDIESLIVALDKEGWIKPRLDERLRSEDLKITHRLLDIIEKRE